MARNTVSQMVWDESRASILRLALRYKNVSGVDYGYLYKNDKKTRRLGVRFHVQLKRPLQDLEPSEVLPTSLKGLQCDVLQATYSIYRSPQDLCNPLLSGVSVGNFNRSSTGTLGLIVRDRLTGSPAILSNWHVLCGSTQARPGDVLVQPGPLHIGSRPPRKVARLERWLPLATGFDAAIGLLNPEIQWDKALFNSSIIIKGIATPTKGMRLGKFGAVSGFTRCVVDGIGGSYVIDYSGCGDVPRSMDGVMLRRDPQFQEPEVSLSGDSGAVWLDTRGRAVALLFAGEDGRGPTAEYALAHPIERVFELLQVEPL